VAIVFPSGVPVERFYAAGRSGDSHQLTAALLSMDDPLDLPALVKRFAWPAGSPQSGERAVAASVLPLGGTPASSQESIPPAIQALVPEYLDNQRKELAKMRALLPQGEFRAIQRFGHNLKGTAGGYGVPALGELGARLEAASLEGNAAYIAETLSEIATVLEGSASLRS
jgi:HPt (histidine-containing phosphotransfer) domain-containing protein